MQTKEVFELGTTPKDRQTFLTEKILCSAKKKKKKKKKPRNEMQAIYLIVLIWVSTGLGRILTNSRPNPAGTRQEWLIAKKEKVCTINWETAGDISLCCVFQTCCSWRESDLIWASAVGGRRSVYTCHKSQLISDWMGFSNVSYKILSPFTHWAMPI